MSAEFTARDLDQLIHHDNNWGRWGPDDQRGALNLVTDEKRVEASRLVRHGRSISISRDFPKTPAPDNPLPAQHYLVREVFPGAGAAIDFYGISYHGFSATHLDALCHIWDDTGMWNGRNPDDHVDSYGVKWGGVEQWRDGLVTRGVLVDIPAFRGTDFVTVDRPVDDEEIEQACAAQGVEVAPGDALLVYSGRDRWDDANGAWGTTTAESGRPGLHASVLRYLRTRDVSVLGWDMMDSMPHDYGTRHTVHLALSAFGVALIDNCHLAPLAAACRDAGTYEVMLVVAPLAVVGGTGSPVNPIALL